MSDLIVPDGQNSDPKSGQHSAQNPSPETGPGSCGNHDHPGTGGRKNRAAIPDVDSCLHALNQLPGLVAMKVLTPSQSNAIRGVYTAILGQHQKSEAGREQQKLPDDDLMQVMRQNPEMLSMLEPLLTDEQITKVMENATDGTDEQT